MVSRDCKVHNFRSPFLFWSSGQDLVIRFYVKIPEEFVCVILQDGCLVVHIPFICMVKFKFLAQFLVDHFAYPVVSNLILFCVNLLHSLTMWFMVSSQSPHNLHLLFCRKCMYICILTLIWLFLIALFCAAIRRDSVSLLRFPFFSHFHVFSWEMSLISRLKHP